MVFISPCFRPFSESIITLLDRATEKSINHCRWWQWWWQRSWEWTCCTWPGTCVYICDIRMSHLAWTIMIYNYHLLNITFVYYPYYTVCHVLSCRTDHTLLTHQQQKVTYIWKTMMTLREINWLNVDSVNLNLIAHAYNNHIYILFFETNITREQWSEYSTLLPPVACGIQSLHLMMQPY